MSLSLSLSSPSTASPSSIGLVGACEGSNICVCGVCVWGEVGEKCGCDMYKSNEHGLRCLILDMNKNQQIVALSPGPSQILSRSCGEKSGDKIWEGPGDEAKETVLEELLRISIHNVHSHLSERGT